MLLLIIVIIISWKIGNKITNFDKKYEKYERLNLVAGCITVSFIVTILISYIISLNIVYKNVNEYNIEKINNFYVIETMNKDKINYIFIANDEIKIYNEDEITINILKNNARYEEIINEYHYKPTTFLLYFPLESKHIKRNLYVENNMIIKM